MPDEATISMISDKLREKGCGMIFVCSFEDSSIKCFANIQGWEIGAILDVLIGVLASHPYNSKSVRRGTLIVSPEDKSLCSLAKLASKMAHGSSPILIVVVAEGMYAAYAAGDVPELTYMCARMRVSALGNCGPSLVPANVNLN